MLGGINLFPLQYGVEDLPTLKIGGTVEIEEGTSNGIYATSWRTEEGGSVYKPTAFAELNGRLAGSGHLTVGSNSPHSRGYFSFSGDNSAFGGTVVSHKSTDAVYWNNENAGSSNAVWVLGQYDSKSLRFKAESAQPYRFGRLVSNGVTAKNLSGARFEIGALGGESTMDLASGSFDVIKVGDGNLMIDGDQTGNVRIEGGTVTIGYPGAKLYAPTRAFTFAGGSMVNAYGTDMSTYIANCDETDSPVVIDDRGSNATWSVALPAAVKGGFVKKGNGVLTLAKAPDTPE